MAYKDPTRKLREAKARYQKIKDEPWFKEQKRQRYLRNREAILSEKRRLYVPKPKKSLKTTQEKKAARALYFQNTKKQHTERMRLWRLKNLDRQRAYARDYYKHHITSKSQYGRLKQTAATRNYELTISYDAFSKIIASPCLYCGEIDQRRGIDRINNSLGYTVENAAPCCKICNYMKKTLTTEDFLKHAKRIVLHNKL